MKVRRSSRVSIAEIQALKARIAPHVFASQYQQRPKAGGTGYCSIDRLRSLCRSAPFELIVHSWDIASTKGGGDYTVCAKFGLAKATGRLGTIDRPFQMSKPAVTRFRVALVQSCSLSGMTQTAVARRLRFLSSRPTRT
jgi:hypothetical protein